MSRWLLPILFFLSAGFSAWNVGLYVAHGQAISLAAAVFCGLVAIFEAAVIARG